MNIRIRTLWRIPMYCIVSGLIANRLVLSMDPFTMPVQPDGSTKIALNHMLILYGVIFAVTLLIGWLLFHRMTRREIFWSAAILAMPSMLIVLLCQVIHPTPAPLSIVFVCVVQTWEWSGFLSVFGSWLGGMSSTFPRTLAPFLFVFFGINDSVEIAAESKESMSDEPPQVMKAKEKEL